MATLLVKVTSFLERSYREISRFGAGRRGGGKEATCLSDIFQRRGRTRSEGRFLGYQQVIHNAKSLKEVIVWVEAAPKTDIKKDTGIA